MFEFPKKSYKRQQNIDIADGLLQSVITISLCLRVTHAIELAKACSIPTLHIHLLV